jgi:undecaprenyl-diphosphatase
MDWLQHLDLSLLKSINTRLAHPLLDAVVPLLREKWFWAPLYLFVLTYVWQRYERRRAWLFFLGIALTIAMADLSSSAGVKKTVRRLRPCNDPEVSAQVTLRIPSCGSGFSFTSSHAANHFAFAVFVGTLLRRRWPRWRRFLLVWAAVVAYAQVYVGVHYVSDVVGGALLGTLIGRITAAVWWKHLRFSSD